MRKLGVALVAIVAVAFATAVLAADQPSQPTSTTQQSAPCHTATKAPVHKAMMAKPGEEAKAAQAPAAGSGCPMMMGGQGMGSCQMMGGQGMGCCPMMMRGMRGGECGTGPCIIVVERDEGMKCHREYMRAARHERRHESGESCCEKIHRRHEERKMKEKEHERGEHGERWERERGETMMRHGCGAMKG